MQHQRSMEQDYRFLMPGIHSAPVNQRGEVATSIPYRLEEGVTQGSIRQELERQPHMRALARALDPERKVYLLHSSSQELLDLAAQYIGTFHRLDERADWYGDDVEDEAVTEEDEADADDLLPMETPEFRFDFSRELPYLEQFEVSQFYGGNTFSGAGGFGFMPQERGRRTPWWMRNCAAPLAVRWNSAYGIQALQSLQEQRALLIFLWCDGTAWQGEELDVFASDNDDSFSGNRVDDFAFELETDVLRLDAPQAESPYKRQVLCQIARQRGTRIAGGKVAGQVVQMVEARRGNVENSTLSKAVANAILRHKGGGALTLRDFAYLNGLRQVNAPEKNTAQQTLVGQEAVKRQLQQIVDNLAFQKRRQELGLKGDSIHCTFAFLGAPGTGKTTWALRLAEEMKQKGLLENTDSICISAAELKAMYVGHTTGRVKALFDQYSVIILDEAYSLTEEGDTDCFTREALAQLCVELEKHASDRLVIFAGYGGSGDPRSDRMLRFLQCNPGISSRVAFKIRFEDFQPRELAEVFTSMMESGGYQVPEGSLGAVEAFFRRLKTGREDFGNCREARNLADRVKVQMSARLSSEKRLTPQQASQVLPEDITAAAEEILGEERMLRRAAPAIGF